MSTSSQSSPTIAVDPLDFVDFSEYDKLGYQQSPSNSPSMTNKSQFVRNSATVSTPSNIPSSQALSGPSHQYDQYKQQTPFVPGALASTIAINQSNSQITGYTLDYMNSSNDEMFDFNSAPSQNMNGAEMDLDFDSQNDFFFQESTVNPNVIGGTESQASSVSGQSSTVGRMYPGMHQQAALAKAQAQQRQQQQIIQQQQHQQQQRQAQQAKQTRPKVPLPSDPIVEQKITQLLSTMRAKAGASSSDGGDNSPLLQLPRTKKEEDDMDEDERLLASEEGKKLSSKERRQLRNKVSARAFRSRRKEYITQLESEIASKVTENGDLRAANRALMEENRRLSDLTRMLLSSPSFSSFLDHLSSNPSPQSQPQPQQQQQQPQLEHRQLEPRQAPKDVNPFGALGQQGTQHQHHQIGMVMMPEQTMDLSMLSINTDGFNYQPQVFTVLEAPEVPILDGYTMSGKTSDFVPESFTPEAEKTIAPVIELPGLPETSVFIPDVGPVDSEQSVTSLDGDIFVDEAREWWSQPVELDTDSLTPVDIFGGIELEKAFSRLELSECEQSAEDITVALASRRIKRLAASLEPIVARLDLLTIDL
ncbi:hypothetical protein F4818DRAFT_435564 [Hypoxylon cercidicola]|nr:hypothetical protein F4818DRAFT_435564 [Hypoxylon cercidicola]